MSTQLDSTDRPLSALGISELEERAYRWLLAHPHVNVSEVARALGLSSSRTQRVLDTIEAKGLSTHTPVRPRRYIPASPDIAIEALARQRQQDIRRAQNMVSNLQEEAAAQRPFDDREMIVELARGEAVRQTYKQLHNMARKEVVSMTRAPLLISKPEDPHSQDDQRSAQAKGVRYRSIVDTEFLGLPHVLPVLREDIKTGQKVRVISKVPFKLTLVDRRIAMIPLIADEADHTALIVRSSDLLDSFYALFEVLWERAVPVPSTGNAASAQKVVDGEPIIVAMHELIVYLATGLNDKKIAYELGVSSATLNRRVVAMMKKLGVRTRFQAGWQARGLWGESGLKTDEIKPE